MTPPVLNAEHVIANSLPTWHAQLHLETNLPTIPAKTVPFNESWSTYIHFLEGNHPHPDDEALLEAADEATFGPPYFLRTDQRSAKHEGEASIKATTTRDVLDLTVTLLKKHAMGFGPDPHAWVLRPWLDLDHAFRARCPIDGGEPVREEGLRIGPEYRAFATPDGRLLCLHRYWPSDAFEDDPTAPNDAANRLETAYETVTQAERDDLRAWSMLAGEALAGVTPGTAPAWALDWTRTEDGSWHLVDAATSPTAYHPTTCAYHADVHPQEK